MINPNELWHRRFGHFGFSSLLNVERINTRTPSLSSKNISICKGCALGKKIKKPFPPIEQKYKLVLELIHSNVCVPIQLSL